MAFALLFTLTAVLGWHYATQMQAILKSDNVWCGADVARHVHWVFEGETVRASLHPLAFILFKSFGVIARPLHALGWPRLFVAGLPVMLIATLAVAVASAYIAGTSLRLQLLLLTVAVLVGPWLWFAIVPESHLLGGVFLLLEGCLLWHGMVNDPNGTTGLRWGALLCGAIATGFTLSNVILAAILWLCLAENRTVRWGGLTALVVVPMLLPPLTLLLPGPSGEAAEKVPNPILRRILIERSWIVPPSPTTLTESGERLTLNQFGMASPLLYDIVATAENPAPVVPRMVTVNHATLWQWTAMLLWIVGAVWVWKQGLLLKVEARLLAGCLVGVGSLVGFHASFSAFEPFMFANHAWPFVLLPGWIAWKHAWRKREMGALFCLSAALLLCLVQTGLSITALLPMLRQL